MASAEICARCGQQRAWSGWRHCLCGHDFGPGLRVAPVSPPPLPTPADRLQRKRDRTFLAWFFISIASLIAAGGLAFIVLSLPDNSRLAGLIERSYGPILPASLYVHYLYSTDPETVMTGLHFLNERKNPAGADRAVELLKSDDDYIWLNAANYAGGCGRVEAVPYLIKALRHTAWRSDDERRLLLQELTGETFSAKFQPWHDWWVAAHPDSPAINWESALGHSPRLPKEESKSLEGK